MTFRNAFKRFALISNELLLRHLTKVSNFRLIPSDFQIRLKDISTEEEKEVIHLETSFLFQSATCILYALVVEKKTY